MSLLEELKDRADKLDAELLALSGRMKEIENDSNAVHICINALDIAEMDAEDALGAIDLPAETITADNVAEFVSDKYQQTWGDVNYAEQDGTRSQQELEDIAPAQPPSAELRSVPGAEEEVRDQSVTTDPDFAAAVSRAEATLAAADPESEESEPSQHDPATYSLCNYDPPAAEPAYVGLQDPELDADWDAMKERQEAGKKLHFSIFGKREEV